MASKSTEAAVTFTNAAGVCQQLAGCHCQQPGALHCQLSDSAELRAVTGRLPTLPDITLVDLVLRDLSTLPGGLFSDASLQALLLSGSRVQSLPADLLTGLETSLRALGLGENQLVDVPTAALTGLTSLERLDLSGNQLRQVKAGALPALGSLAELNLAENELSKLDVDAFTTLIALRTLWLEGNRLNVTQLSNGALRPLVSLERLSLDHNLLAGPLTFQLTSALPADLTTLSLADNNLTSISSGALTPLAALTSLDLSGNRIDVIDARAFAGLSRLRTLRLDGNHIVTLPAGGLSGLKALTELDLSRNSLQALTEDVLTPLPALRRLLLRNNDLIQLDGQLLRALPALKKVDIAENSLHCDCRLRELATYLSDSSAWLEDEDVRQITCATPTALENAPLVALASRPDSAQPCETLESTDPTDLQVALRSVDLSAGEQYQFCVTLRQLLSGVELPLPSAYECDTYVHQRLVDLKDIVSTEICQLETQWGYTQWRHAYHSS
ncbi:Carboxypeptidase N subunit 2 [Amphibalanus amphitrite]|uniref:Carboxypeptidase N subunit 2 n=1 Tax=Amphibalanus amphitrite TaxID=1232801 RepID=A0A6A4WC07_AMPAM|nr:Carboxypeptidase N subunit 2 [Amphibalanus amphitrite]